MIFVKRTAAPLSLNLNDAESAGAKELQRAKDFLKDNNVPMSAEQFKAYADEEVRDALKDLFFNKCAYCESPVAGSSQTDVEHYRPKGAVKENAAHPGYWWLAMDWTNLVLSCMHCNQHRRQLNLSPDMSEAEILKAIIDNDVKATGKKNAFPTEDEVWVTDPAIAMTDEHPLLLDPTVTDPEPLLSWSSRGDFALVGPRDGNKRADVTIQTLGLNRRRLCEERMTKLTLLSLIMIDIRAALADLDGATTDGEAVLVKNAILRDLKKLAAMGDAKQPHAALARDFLFQAKTLIATTIP